MKPDKGNPRSGEVCTGMFDNPYRCPDKIAQARKEHWDAAYEAHQKSVVSLKMPEMYFPLQRKAVRQKNLCGMLPGRRKVRKGSSQSGNRGSQRNEMADGSAREGDICLTQTYQDADYAFSL